VVHLPPKFRRGEALPRGHAPPRTPILILGFGEGPHDSEMADEFGLVKKAAGHLKNGR